MTPLTIAADSGISLTYSKFELQVHFNAKLGIPYSSVIALLSGAHGVQTMCKRVYLLVLLNSTVKTKPHGMSGARIFFRQFGCLLLILTN